MSSRIGVGLVVCVLASFALSSSLLAAGPDLNEPNETPATAIGPLVGGQNYDGSIASVSDQDYYYFNTAAAGSYQVVITDTSPWYGCRKDFVALSATGDLLAFTSTDGSSGMYGTDSGALAFATTSAAKVYVRAVGERNPYCYNYGTSYTIRVVPAGSIVPALPTAPPPPPTRACIKAKQSVALSKAAIKKLSKRESKASGDKATRLRKRLRAERRDLTRHRREVKKRCT